MIEFDSGQFTRKIKQSSPIYAHMQLHVHADLQWQTHNWSKMMCMFTYNHFLNVEKYIQCFFQ